MELHITAVSSTERDVWWNSPSMVRLGDILTSTFYGTVTSHEDQTWEEPLFVSVTVGGAVMLFLTSKTLSEIPVIDHSLEIQLKKSCANEYCFHHFYISILCTRLLRMWTKHRRVILSFHVGALCNCL